MQASVLSTSTVMNEVPRRVCGTYELGNYVDGRPIVKYVGRSDSDLRRRLMQHARSPKFQWFRYTATSTLFEAYRLECRGWHLHRDTVNRIHPDSPTRLPYRCPYCQAGEEVAGGLAPARSTPGREN